MYGDHIGQVFATAHFFAKKRSLAYLRDLVRSGQEV
jgi:hypothetical protein